MSKEQRIVFTKDDLEFLRLVGICADDAVEATEEESSIEQSDGTLRLLKEYGIPLTRENYLYLAFAGTPPPEPLDGELKADLPWQIRREDHDE